ncbi:MAG TPA: ABC transporter permease [Frankiaceae bacterium]|jgi:peptide/nickel transport system permease protein|nr:ABC transporter permease [Frankiaceae bacterium]
MIGFLGRRLAYVIPVLLGVTIVVFATVKIIPGDPATLLAGPGALPSTVASLRQRLGLGGSIFSQYWHWFSHALQGDLGLSIAHQQPASNLVFSAFGNTLILAAYAAVIAIVFGLVIGALGALHPRGIIGRLTSGISAVSISIPQYSLAVLLIIYLAVNTGFFPVSGMHGNGGGGFGDLLWHGFLPALTAGLVPGGVIARIFRSALLDVLSMDFVEALRARGFSRRRILAHAVHNAVPSLLTIAGLQIGYLLGGVVFVETIFTWPGLGLLVYQSISARDLPVIQAGVLLSAVAFVLINIIVDTMHALIDPRVRTS